MLVYLGITHLLFINYKLMIDFLNSLKELSKEELEKKLKNLTDEEKEILNNCEKCESVN